MEMAGADMKKMIVLGAAGHARSVVDMILQNGEYEICGLVAGKGEKGFWGISVIGQDEELAGLYEQGITYAFVAVGNNLVRKKLSDYLQKIGYHLITVISKYAVVSPYARIQSGTAVMPGAVINAGVQVGKGCIINTHASIDHDDVIGDYSHVAPGCTISGYTKIGKACFLGTGTKVIDAVVIGDQVTAGAGTVIIRNIPDGQKIAGVPARCIEKGGQSFLHENGVKKNAEDSDCESGF